MRQHNNAHSSKVPYYLVLNHVFIPQLAMASNTVTAAIPAKRQCEIVAIPNVSYEKSHSRNVTQIFIIILRSRSMQHGS